MYIVYLTIQCRGLYIMYIFNIVCILQYNEKPIYRLGKGRQQENYVGVWDVAILVGYFCF